MLPGHIQSRERKTLWVNSGDVPYKVGNIGMIPAESVMVTKRCTLAVNGRKRKFPKDPSMLWHLRMD